MAFLNIDSIILNELHVKLTGICSFLGCICPICVNCGHTSLLSWTVSVPFVSIADTLACFPGLYLSPLCLLRTH